MLSRIDLLLNEIATACGNPSLSSKDWENLSMLAVHLHQDINSPNMSGLKQDFVKNGCSVHRAQFFCRQLEIFQTLLRMYDAHKINASKPR